MKKRWVTTRHLSSYCPLSRKLPDAVTLPACIVWSMMAHAVLLLTITNAGDSGANVWGGSVRPALSVQLGELSDRRNSADLQTEKNGVPRLAHTSVAASRRGIKPEKLLPLVVPPHYFRPSELEERPQALAEINITYPEEKGIVRSGAVILEVLINENGQADQINIESSDLPDSFQLNAAQSFHGAEFVPGKINGLPVKSRLRIEVSFMGLLSAQQ